MELEYKADETWRKRTSIGTSNMLEGNPRICNIVEVVEIIGV